MALAIAGDLLGVTAVEQRLLPVVVDVKVDAQVVQVEIELVVVILAVHGNIHRVMTQETLKVQQREQKVSFES